MTCNVASKDAILGLYNRISKVNENRKEWGKKKLALLSRFWTWYDLVIDTTWADHFEKHLNRCLLSRTSLLKSYEICTLIKELWLKLYLFKGEMKITADWLFTAATCCWLLPRAMKILRNVYCMYCARSCMEDYPRLLKIMQHYVRSYKLVGMTW